MSRQRLFLQLASPLMLKATPFPTTRQSLHVTIEGFATELAREDPTAAIAWAETIGDEQLRIEALSQVAESWYRRDQTAATTWLEASELPPETQQAVLETSTTGRGGGGGGRRGR